MKNIKALLVMMTVACAVLLPGREPLPVKTALQMFSSGAMTLQPNGDFVVSVERQGRWQEVGRLSGDRFLREQRLDLAPWLQGAKKAHVRIRQEGGGASHLDAVLLGGGVPLSVNTGSLNKLSRRDNDLAAVNGRTVDLNFAAAGDDRVLTLAGRIENKIIPSEPFQFPLQNTFRKTSPSSSFYSYCLGSAAPPRRSFASAAWLADVGGRQPFFASSVATGTGHPTGTTYGWVSNDERNLYVTIDFTPDNTYDNDKDYAKVYVRGSDGLREFKVSVPEKRWGRAHFVYTDKVAYQHKVYDFAIPLAGLPRNAEGGLDVSFAAYGTAGPMMDFEMKLAYDPDLRRYLLVIAGPGSSTTDIFGVFLDEDGNFIGSLFPIATNANDHERRPDVAYDRVNRRFMVTWHQIWSSNDTEHVLGEVLTSDGIPYAPPFQIAVSSDHLYSPSLAFDEVNQRYLVAWVSSDDETYSWVLGQLRDSGGAVVGPGEFSISPSGSYAGVVDLAFDTQSQLYMVVWDDEGGTIAGPNIAALPEKDNIAGQMVAAGGTLVGGPFAVSTGEYIGFMPTVANDSVNHRFLAAWVQMPSLSVIPSLVKEQRHERFRARAQAPYTAAYPATEPVVAGQLFDNLGAASGDTLGIGLNLSYMPLWPRLAYDPVHGRYLAVWFGMAAPVFPDPPTFTFMGQFLDNNGTAIGTDPAENFEIVGDIFPFNPAPLACNTVCGNFLTIWLGLSGSGGIEVIGGGCPVLPAVETLPVSAITTTDAQGGGNVTSDGGANVFGRGVCWNTTGDPTIYDPHSSDGSGTGLFGSNLSGLLPATTYRVRAYASNSVGTAYGDEIAFTTFRWQVTFLADAGGTLAGPTPQYVNTGGSCLPVEAAAKTGYFFRKWEGSNAFSSLLNPLVVTNVSSDLVFNARIGLLGMSVTRRIEKAWIITSEYADVQLDVSGLADSGAAKFVLMRKTTGGGWEVQKEVLPGDFSNGHYSFASLPLEKDKKYSFRVEAYSATGVLLGVSAEVTI